MFMPKLIIITPNWLSVDKAITFFKSFSKLAPSPAINRVRTEINNKVLRKAFEVDRNGKNRITRNTPAVTRVDEWTKAETGVGAAMAAGSHLEKGIWALFVIAATVIVIMTMKDMWKSHIDRIFQWPCNTRRPIEIKIITSPIRLASTVSIPAASDFAFW